MVSSGAIILSWLLANRGNCQLIVLLGFRPLFAAPLEPTLGFCIIWRVHFLCHNTIRHLSVGLLFFNSSQPGSCHLSLCSGRQCLIFCGTAVLCLMIFFSSCHFFFVCCCCLRCPEHKLVKLPEYAMGDRRLPICSNNSNEIHTYSSWIERNRGKVKCIETDCSPHKFDQSPPFLHW